MIFDEGLLGLVLLALWIYAVLDVIATEAFLCRNLPKMAWLFVVIFLPEVGAIAWLALGRPVGAGWRPGDTQIRTPRRRVVGLEDSDAWSGSRPSRPAAIPPTSTPPAAIPPASTSPTAQGPMAFDPSESAAARERRLMEWEAELRRREDALREDPPSEPSPN